MMYLRRLSLVLLSAAVLAALPTLLMPSVAVGQGKKQPIQPGPAPGPGPIPPDVKVGGQFSAIKLIENDKYQKQIDDAIEAVNDGDWQSAVEGLQAILESKEDFFAKVESYDPKTGQKRVRWSSVKFEANNLIAKMPAVGQKAYEDEYGVPARQLLEKAKATGSREMLAECAQKYLHTKAGAVANDLLATTFLDRGEYFTAALRFERLIGPDPATSKVSDLMLFKAALAFNRAGYNKRAEQLWEVLYPRMQANGGLKLGDNKLASVKDVKAILGAGKVNVASNPHDWPVVGGNLARSAQAKGSPPMLDYVLWTRPTIQDVSDETREPDPGMQAKLKLETLLKAYGSKDNVPVMPGGFPIATNGQLIYRSYNGVTAVYLHDMFDKDGKLEAKAGSISFKSTAFEGALATAMESNEIRPNLDSWIDQTYNPSGFANLVFENSTVGTLTTDNRNIYAVDDLAVPAPPKYLMQQHWGNVNSHVKPLVEQNTLWAFNLASGKIEWRLGDPSKNDEYTKTHFICAPISVGGKLYVLNEKNSGDLRLLCLDPLTGKLIGEPQKLGTVKGEHRYMADLSRRVTAIHLAYAEGVLVCPTNAGEILGVDLMSRSLAWAYPYRQKPANQNAFPKQFEQFPNGPIALTYNDWKVAPPFIVDGKVVFTAPDASAVHCINLRDGTEVWKRPRLETDLFLAGVFNGKVVIVGKNSVRALDLTDGEAYPMTLQTGDLPSGQGVASQNIYYLPLRRGEVLAIDLERWAIKAHNRASKTTGIAPGNLVFYEGMVLSQTPTAIVAYPQLTAKLEEAELAFKKDASIANQLFRGELRLADGQVQAAVDDLVAVLKRDPQGDLLNRAKNRLYEALTDLLQADFDKTSPKYLEQYRELCKVPTNAQEQLQREAKYNYILALGRESQGDLVAAFLAYRDFGGSPLYRDDGVPSQDDPLYKVPTHLWLRGRINAMFEKGSAAQKAALEKRIETEWVSVKDKGELEGIRQFTAMFDVPFSVGREARLEIANVIIARQLKDNFLEAELNLQQLRVPQFRHDPEVGGKALEALARLELVKQGDEAARLAAAYYREIFKEFPKAVLHKGKTGAVIFNEMAEDKRLRPYLEEPGVIWGKGEVKHRDLKGGEVQGIQGFVFQPEGELVGPMQNQRLLLDPSNQQNPILRLVDISTNKVLWNTTLGFAPQNSLFFNYLYLQTSQPTGFHPNAKYRYFQVKGHLAVVQVGMMVYGLDMDQGKVLWNRLLYDPNSMVPNFGHNIQTDEQGRLWVMHQNQFGGFTKVRVGQVGTVQATYVVLTTPKGMVVLDPLKGTVLWSKPGIGGSLDVFGDDQHIYFIETTESNSAVGAGRCLRASDGELVATVPDFREYYNHRLRILGRQILTAEPRHKGLTMRLYDVHTGKDVWKKSFDNDPVPLQTDNPNLCGVIERDTGKMIVMDLQTSKEVLTANVKQYRVDDNDMKELYQPWLVEDGERYYVALNAKFSPRLMGGTVSNNFANGTRCIPVNGWFCALGKNGEFLWHGDDRYLNQMLVVEQFKTLPCLLFTSRFGEPGQQGGFKLMAKTGSVNKSDGKAIWWSPARDSNGTAQFYAFTIDLKAGKVNMVGYNGTVQHYVDEAAPKKDGVAPQQAPPVAAAPAALSRQEGPMLLGAWPK